MTGTGRSAQATDLANRMAGYVDTIINDTGADLTAAMRDLTNMGKQRRQEDRLQQRISLDTVGQ